MDGWRGDNATHARVTTHANDVGENDAHATVRVRNDARARRDAGDRARERRRRRGENARKLTYLSTRDRPGQERTT